MTPFPELKKNVLGRMAESLPAHLSYHSVAHTELVIERCIYIAEKEGLSEDQIRLLRTAALYHDFGFTSVYKDHEEKGCEVVRKELPAHGYSKEDIDKICGMIMATKIPQTPTNIMEKVIADADLEYLGTDKFEEIGDTLFHELKHFNPELSRDEWNDIQIKFMSKHSYHTDYCKQYREWRKEENLESLKQ